MTRLVEAIRAAAESVRDHADELNRLDAAAGDGDLGVTMTIAAASIVDLVPELAACATPADVLSLSGRRIARDAPSTSGTLVATALLAAARVANTGEPAGLSTLLDAGVAAIADRGGAEPGDKTMLDALAPAAAAAGAATERGESFEESLRAAAEAARSGAKATVSMTPRHGRAGWLAERSAGSEDAGATLVAIILTAASDRISAAPALG